MPLKSRGLIDESDPRVAKIGHPAPPWLINYADLMTELVCFFIILYALSAVLDKKMMDTAKETKEIIKEENIGGKVEVTKEGIEITFQEKEDKALFESGSAELNQNIKNVLDKLTPVILKMENEIFIQGHTDNTPISTSKYKSNWELSTARATSVVNYLIHEKQFSPNRLSAVGYGEYKPVADNKTEEGRSMNRRVVFLVKNLPQKFKKTL